MRIDASGASEALYFSFMTLTTLGYGDILAVTPLSRMTATLDAIVGWRYFASAGWNTRTGMLAPRMSLSATLPRSRRFRPDRP